jgi:hypothetical protein
MLSSGLRAGWSGGAQASRCVVGSGVSFVGWGIFVRHVVDVEYDGLQAQEVIGHQPDRLHVTKDSGEWIYLLIWFGLTSQSEAIRSLPKLVFRWEARKINGG